MSAFERKSALLIELDDLADRFADAIAAPYMFWLGAGRRLPGDERPLLAVESFNQECLRLSIAIIAALKDVSTPDIQDLFSKTTDCAPRADAIALVLEDRKIGG